MGIVEEEADESQFWLDLLIGRGVIDPEGAKAIQQEASALVAIAVASIRTARRSSLRNPRSASRNPQCS